MSHAHTNHTLKFILIDCDEQVLHSSRVAATKVGSYVAAECEYFMPTQAKIASWGTGKHHDPLFMLPLGLTPLHLAASNGCSEAVKVLLDSGADVNKQETEGKIISRNVQGLYHKGF